MNGSATTSGSPLARVTAGLSDEAIRAITIGAVVLGAAALVAIAMNQSYDRTQVFAVFVASLAIATSLIRRLPGDWFGAGLMFFAGASLSGMGLGWAVLMCGALAAGGAASSAARAGRAADAGVLAFFASAGAVVALVVAIALVIEG